jgi:hypothetical protein
LAADALSGPDNLAARLRAALDGRPLTSVSLPLDIGAATEIIPVHLRRAVTARHPCCAFPGCDQPASVCDIHHIVPRSRGGPTSLPNLVPLCTFHHLTAIHRWGWTLTLQADGTTTATSPDGTRTLHSHGPPGQSSPNQASQAAAVPGCRCSRAAGDARADKCSSGLSLYGLAHRQPLFHYASGRPESTAETRRTSRNEASSNGAARGD